MGLCKVEYLAQKERIQQRLQAGYPVSFIHRELSGEGVLTMSSRSLYRLINAEKVGKLAGFMTPQPASRESTITPAWRKALVVPSDNIPSIKPFAHDPSMNDDDLW